ncbi:glycine N-acyltransferase-like protein 3 isoform X2 [Dysidea avara]
MLKLKNKINADIMTDAWPDFSCTVIKLPNSEVKLAINLFFSESPEKLEKLLSSPKFKDSTLIAVLDDETARQLRGMKISWPCGLKENVLLTYKTLYFPGKLSDLPKWSCPEDVIVSTLKSDHAKVICGSWNYCELPDRIKYFEYLIKNCNSVGVFLKSDISKPVSWAVLANYGHIIHIHTVQEHRRKGYSRIVMLNLMKQMLEVGMTPILEISEKNTASVQLNTSLGLVELFGSSWKLYS